MRLFWIIHNNTCNTGRVIVEGLKKYLPELKHLSSREDIIWLREPSEDLITRWGDKRIGHFPDSNSFIPELASPNFWQELENINKSDIIVVTVNSGPNHNIYQALDIINKKDLYNQVVILDEDESCKKWHSQFTVLYDKAKLILTGLGDHVHLRLRNKRENVHFFGFCGMEDRYFPKEYKKKDIDVYFKSRVEGWLTPRVPFRDKLLDVEKKGIFNKMCIMPSFNEDEGNSFLKIISGDRYHPDYYNYLNRSKIAIYLNGFNPIGYQFWESCANKCLVLHQTPWASQYYNGGDSNPRQFHWEHYDPPFIPGEDFYYFETPEDLEDLLMKLSSNPDLISRAAEKCYNKALNFTSERQAHKFIGHINKTFGYSL